MKRLFQELIRQLDQRCDCVLATIVQDSGSAPRGAGAQMLIGPDGRLAGTIGGGSVENTSVALARELLRKRESRLQDFSLRRNPAGDIGMICGGEVTVWFQYIPAEDPVWRDLAAQVLACFQGLRPARLLLDFSGGPGRLCEEGSAYDETRFFGLSLPLGERAVIFGGGHIAQALVPILRTVGFRPVVYDCRPDYAQPERFPLAEKVICGDYLAIHNHLTLTPEDYVVVMTNGHAYDFEVQRQLLPRDLAYIGVIGSRKKTAALNQKLREAGISEGAIRRGHGPIGTAIKAVTPEEIAVSIAGEMIYERALRRENAEPARHICPMG